MSDDSLRDQWVREVFRNPGITDATRVMLLSLAQDMDEDGRVEVSRDEIAVRLNRHPRKITDRYNAGQAAGFLAKAGGGNRSGSNVFQATMPGRDKGAARRHPNEPERVPPVGTHPTGKGAGSQHPSGGTKGATNRHPFGDKSADGRHPSDRERVLQTGTLSPGKSAGERHPSPPPPYKDRAGAHSNADRSDGDAGEALVIPLFEQENKTPPPAGAAAPAATEGEPKTLTLEQRVNALAKAYTDLVPLSTFIAVRQLVKRAINADKYTDEQISDGLLKLADEKRPVTANTLRIAMEGLPTAKPSNAAPGSGQRNLPDPSEYGKGRASI